MTRKADKYLSFLQYERGFYSDYPISTTDSISVNGNLLTNLVTQTVGPTGTNSNIVTTGSADESKINTALISVNTAGGGVAQLRTGTYVQSSSAHVLPKSNTIAQGEGYASKITLSDGKTIKIDQQSKVKLRDFYIDGTNHTGVNTYGVYIDRSDDVTVEGLWLLNMKAYGIFLTNQAASTTVSRFRFINNRIVGRCNNDLIGGGPGVAGAAVADILIHGNFIQQDATLSGAGVYLNAIDIVAQQKVVITDNITYGGILLGGEKIPHTSVNVMGNVVNAPVGIASTVAVGQIAVLCASNTDPQQTADSTAINIVSNQITSGNIFIQGQSATSSRTRKVTISKNNIVNNASASYADHTYGINLNYVANVSVEGNTVDGAVRGISLTNTDAVDISNNTFLNCTTPIVLSGTNTKLTGHNNIGINPDILYAQGNVTGATTFNRVNGYHITATLTGNITVTLSDTFFKGELLTLALTQDATGSRTVTWPSNFKKAGGTLTLTTTANATDVIAMRWDGTNWAEIGRSLNIS